MLKHEHVKLVKIFVSSPGDVSDERDVLDEAVVRVNRTAGLERGVRFETWRWEKDMVPQIGPLP
ncbi:MAG: hypothetical protein ABFS02_02425 [Pseudomonadota bacterium]